LEWDGDNEHIFLLQEKINACIMAIETRQLNEKYPLFGEASRFIGLKAGLQTFNTKKVDR